MNLIQPARQSRRLAWALLALILLSPIPLWFVPWQQSVYAQGRVVAFLATERQLDVDSPIAGRIVKWHVNEGDRVQGPLLDKEGKLVLGKDGKPVQPGTLLVTLRDPDVELLNRLIEQRNQTLERQKAAQERILSYSEQIDKQRAALVKAMEAFDKRIEMAKQRKDAAGENVRGAHARAIAAADRFNRAKAEKRDGLISEFDYVQFEQTLEDRKAAFYASQNAFNAAKDEVLALSLEKERTREDIESRIRSVQALVQGAYAEKASAIRELQDIERNIARQENQEVRAPCDGTVYRIIASAHQGGAIVSMGERLAIITPDIPEDTRRMVELYIDGNDAPQLTTLWSEQLSRDPNAKIRVRLQFEGWPAIQWIGWPSMAVGTFGGLVRFIDPHDDKGKFRIFVEPDPDEIGPDGEPRCWPDAYRLRQGVRVQGWVLLNRVSLGWEIWRRFNGFPPVVLDSTGQEFKPEKPAKIRIPK